jgi:hypothetical protein
MTQFLGISCRAASPAKNENESNEQCTANRRNCHKLNPAERGLAELLLLFVLALDYKPSPIVWRLPARVFRQLELRVAQCGGRRQSFLE